MCKYHTVDVNKQGQLYCPNCKEVLSVDTAKKVIKEIFIDEKNTEKILKMFNLFGQHVSTEDHTSKKNLGIEIIRIFDVQ